jgi:hypothetical protein
MIHIFSFSGDRRAAGLSILQAVYHSRGEKERTPLALKTVLCCSKGKTIWKGALQNTRNREKPVIHVGEGLAPPGSTMLLF